MNTCTWQRTGRSWRCTISGKVTANMYFRDVAVFWRLMRRCRHVMRYYDEVDQ